jgi:RimJ/RimL family protein N-acetyltransferase
MLRTPRLVLRRFTEHDAAALVALNSDPETVRYAVPEYVDDPPGLEDVRNGPLARILAGYDEDPAVEYWAAMTRPGGDFAGFFFLRPEQGQDAWELGYRLRRALWGQGLATEGAREVVRYGFEELGVQRIVAYVVAPNVASIRVVEKLGMRHVGSSEWRGFEDRCYERRRA